MLSIIIPTLNEEKNLVNLLTSITHQTFKDYEIIVADAGSTDKTVEIAKEFGARLVKGGMPSVGRNAGARVAKGNLLFFFDADVVLEKDFLQKMLRKFKQRKLDVATCFFVPLSEKRIDKLLHELLNRYYQMTQKFLPHAAGFCILVKREIHEKIGGFDEEVVLAEDLDYVRRAGKVGKFAVLTDPKIFVSVRRLERDGRLNVAVKYILVEAYTAFIGGVKSDIFHYSFGHSEQVRKEKLQERLRKKFLLIANRRLKLPKEELNKIYSNLISYFNKES